MEKRENENASGYHMFSPHQYQPATYAGNGLYGMCAPGPTILHNFIEAESTMLGVGTQNLERPGAVQNEMPRAKNMQTTDLYQSPTVYYTAGSTPSAVQRPNRYK